MSTKDVEVFEQLAKLTRHGSNLIAIIKLQDQHIQKAFSENNSMLLRQQFSNKEHFPDQAAFVADVGT